MIVIPRGEVPPSSMESARGTIAFGSQNCVTLIDGKKRYLLIFPEPSEMRVEGNRKVILSVNSRMVDGETYEITGSTLGKPGEVFRKRHVLSSNCSADQVFLFNGSITK